MLTKDVEPSNQHALNVARVALACEDLGRYEEAGKLYRKALGRCSDEKIKLFCTLKWPMTLMDRCLYREAESATRQSLQVLVNTYGQTHEASMRCVGNLARILRHCGKFHEAYHLVVDALESSTWHPLRSVVGTKLISILAKILNEQGRYLDCEKLSQMMVCSCCYHLGPDHPFTYN